MTNPNLAYVQLIIDRSGSMQPLRQTVVSGLNEFLGSQRKLPGVCHVGLCWFGGVIDRPFDNRPLTDVQDLALGDYVPDGMTPLHAAMITSINALGTRLAALPENDRPGLVTVLTITDGAENSSGPEYTAEAVKQLVETQTKRYSWNFQYLGANQDATLVGSTYGIPMGNAATFTASVSNAQAAFSVLNASTSRGRRSVLRGFSAAEASASMLYSSSEVASLVDPNADTQISAITQPAP